MANTITAFLETLVAAAGDYSAATVGQCAFLDSVYLDVKPEVARAGKNIQIYFPDFGQFSDIGAGDLVDQNIQPNYVDLAFNSHPAASFTLRDFEQFQTGVEIREKFLDPMYKRAAEYLNGIVSGLITPANFNVNPIVYGNVAGEVQVVDQLTAWDHLADSKVPLNDPANLSLLVHNNVYRRMLGDNAWVQENQVSAVIAQAAREKGQLANAFNFKPVWDQQAPKIQTLQSGTVALTNGNSTVAGTGTSFTSLNVGQGVVFASDTTQTIYQIGAISNATTLNLTVPFAGATNASTNLSTRTYYSLATHKYAIALALRPLPPPDTNVVHYLPLTYKGIPMRLMFSYQQRNLGWLTSVDFGYAVGVIRPSFGVLIQS